MSDFLVICLVSGVVAALVSKISHWALAQEVRRLQFAVSVLEERLLSEIKRRARSIAQKNQEFDADVIAAAQKNGAPPKPAEPWFMQFLGTKDAH